MHEWLKSVVESWSDWGPYGFLLVGAVATATSGERPRLVVLQAVGAAVAVLLFVKLVFQRAPGAHGLREAADLAVLLAVWGALLYTALVNWIVHGGGAARLLAWRGEKWVKECDYVYTGLAIPGAIGSLARASELLQGPAAWDLLAPLVLVLAIVVRLIRTRAEIEGWTKATRPRATGW
ncbi:MAG: hypothetical protein KIT25_06500 [Enhydrobacter sp.]|nr:MAG: hypothetical protein KIT25_06500 [Enhydrobacter sp.]